MFLQFLTHFFGIDDLSGPWYAFWSGIGSDIGEVTIIGGIIAMYRKHNCHSRGCWRLGKHNVDGTPYVVCAKHHPDVPDKGANHQEILRHHRRAWRDDLTRR